MLKRIITVIAIIYIGITVTFAQNANTQLSNLNANTNINSVLRPNSNATLDLGTSTRQFRDLNISQNINIGGSKFISRNGGNIWIGENTGSFNTTGYENSVFGNYALNHNTTGTNNAVFGVFSMLSNTTGYRNSAFGGYSMVNNTEGTDNCAFGESSLINNLTGRFNCALGVGALSSNTTGERNVAIGFSALFDPVTGFDNVAIGYQAGGMGNQNTCVGSLARSGADNNTSVGYSSLFFNQSSGISSFGAYSLYNNTSGSGSASFGFNTLYKNTTGNDNSGFGTEALFNNTTGYANSVLGRSTLYNNSTGIENTAIGMNAMLSNTNGARNAAVGNWSMWTNTTGSNNTAIGYVAGTIFGSVINNSTAVGNSTLTTASNQIRLGNGVITSIGGQVGWTTLSDGRFKKDISENVPGMEFINQLKPVTYHVDVNKLNRKLNIPDSLIDSESLLEKENILYTGFIAQEVEEAAKKIGYNFSGVDAPKNENDYYGLRYAEFVVPVIKALQELDKKNVTLEIRNEELKKEIDNLKRALLKNTPEEEVQQANRMEQNVPNPFTSATTIKYSLSGDVVSAFIKIYSVDGKEMLSKAITKTGFGEITIDTRSLSPGIYSYSLIIGGATIDSKLMILTK